MASCEKDADIVKIPPLGKHYTLRWAEEDMTEERESSSVVKLKRKSGDNASAASGHTVAGSGDNQSGNNNNNNNTGASGPKELLKKAAKIWLVIPLLYFTFLESNIMLIRLNRYFKNA